MQTYCSDYDIHLKEEIEAFLPFSFPPIEISAMSCTLKQTLKEMWWSSECDDGHNVGSMNGILMVAFWKTLKQLACRERKQWNFYFNLFFSQGTKVDSFKYYK